MGNIVDFNKRKKYYDLNKEIPDKYIELLLLPEQIVYIRDNISHGINCIFSAKEDVAKDIVKKKINEGILPEGTSVQIQAWNHIGEVANYDDILVVMLALVNSFSKLGSALDDLRYGMSVHIYEIKHILFLFEIIKKYSSKNNNSKVVDIIKPLEEELLRVYEYEKDVILEFENKYTMDEKVAILELIGKIRVI